MGPRGNHALQLSHPVAPPLGIALPVFLRHRLWLVNCGISKLKPAATNLNVTKISIRRPACCDRAQALQEEGRLKALTLVSHGFSPYKQLPEDDQLNPDPEAGQGRIREAAVA